jgi:hypothetical protein
MPSGGAEPWGTTGPKGLFAQAAASPVWCRVAGDVADCRVVLVGDTLSRHFAPKASTSTVWLCRPCQVQGLSEISCKWRGLMFPA